MEQFIVQLVNWVPEPLLRGPAEGPAWLSSVL